MLGRLVTGKGDDILPLLVSAFRTHFLRGAGLAGDGETRNRRGRGRAPVAHDAAQRVPDLRGGFRRDDLAQNHRRRCAPRLAVLSRDRLYHPRCHEFAAIRDRRHRGGHLQWGYPDLVAHRNACNGNFAPGLWRPNHPSDFSGQFNSSPFAESKAPDVLVEFLVADRDRQLRCPNVA